MINAGRQVGALGLVVAGVLTAGCSSTAWWAGGGASSCGPPALARVAGQVLAVGSCGGSFVLPARNVTLHVGQAVDIHMTEEGAGPSGNRLVPDFPLPYVSGSSVLDRTAAGSDKATATYKAEHPGRAVLVTRGHCILNGKTRVSCPVIDVTVIP